MTVSIPLNFAEAAIQFRNTGDPDPWYITFGVDLTDMDGDYLTAGLNISQAWTATFNQSIHQSTTCMGVQLTISNGGPDYLRVFIPRAVEGGVTTAKLPQNCALLVDKRTARGGRKGRGRFFVPNILDESDVSNTGVITPTVSDDMQEYADTFLTLLNSAEPGGVVPPGTSTPMYLLHNSDEDPDLVTTLLVQQTIATQRRRLR